jgi:hypothetical protein
MEGNNIGLAGLFASEEITKAETAVTRLTRE